MTPCLSVTRRVWDILLSDRFRVMRCCHFVKPSLRYPPPNLNLSAPTSIQSEPLCRISFVKYVTILRMYDSAGINDFIQVFSMTAAGARVSKLDACFPPHTRSCKCSPFARLARPAFYPIRLEMFPSSRCAGWSG